MNYLITGSTGYLGERFTSYLHKKKYNDVLISFRKNITIPNWCANFKGIVINENQVELSEYKNNIDTVIHLAGLNASSCEKNSKKAIEVNGNFTKNLLLNAIENNIKRFIFISTAHVYSSPLNGNINEKTKTKNNHPYATSNIVGENYVYEAHQNGLIEGVIMRLSNTFGAPMTKQVNCWSLLINDLCRQVVTRKNIILNSSGKQKRNFIPINDACKAIEHLSNINIKKNSIYNVGSNLNTSVIEIAELINKRYFKLMGIKKDIIVNSGFEEKVKYNLEYDISKLLKSGFKLSTENLVYKEIDDLLIFCIKNFG